ncbi:hypothetical protein LCGC14_2367950, partial [marine sediment metagenome]
GSCIENMIYTDSYGIGLDPGSMACFGNKHVYAVDMGAIDVPLIPGRQYTLMADLDTVLATSDPLFTIAGGGIKITDFYGIVTTQIGATNFLIQSVGTTGPTTLAYTTDVAADTDAVGTT